MFLDPRKVTHVVIHTAAASSEVNDRPVAIDQTMANVRAYHMRPKRQGGKGWTDIGYQFWIRFSGLLEEGRPINKVGAHVEGFNSRSVGICCAGHGDIQPFTPEQWKTAVNTTVDVLVHFDLVGEFKKNQMRVIGHREINKLIAAGVATGVPRTYKTCPGTKVDMKQFRLACLAEVNRRGL